VLSESVLLNVSWKVAVASSRLSSPVSSGIADTNRSVRFSWLKGRGGAGGTGFALACLRSSRAVSVAPPVMRMGVRCWFSIGRSFQGEANAAGVEPGRLSGGLGVSAASLESGRHQTKTRALS